MKDRYLELSMNRDLPERRKRKDRRIISTMVNPEVDRRRVYSRRQKDLAERNRQMILIKKRKERKDLILGLIYGCAGIGLSVWLTFRLIETLKLGG